MFVFKWSGAGVRGPATCGHVKINCHAKHEQGLLFGRFLFSTSVNYVNRHIESVCAEKAALHTTGDLPQRSVPIVAA